MIHKDQLSRPLELQKTPKRIVSLVPSQTELLTDLGLEASIVGVTKFCVHPKHLKQEKVIVGGTKQVHFDKIKALQPDIILCNKEENTKEMISELETIAPVHISDVYILNHALELIEMYGNLFSEEKNANLLIRDIKESYKDFGEFINSRKKLKVVYFIWKNPWMVAATETFINEMLHINNFVNYFANLKRYPEIELDRIDKSVDLILLSSEPFPFKKAHVEALELKFPKSKVVLVDGAYFSWYGSRLRNAFEYFKTLHLKI